MPVLSDFKGQGALYDGLIRTLDEGTFVHAYLLSGASGMGKRTLARLMARAALCRDTDHAAHPCGTCAACQKTTPPDLTELGGDGATLSVDAIRRLREDAFLLPNESAYRVMILAEAQTMTPQAQNALLKILEEPPSYGVFILLSDNPEKLLPTVRSRCTELAMSALSQDMLIPALEKEFPKVGRETLVAAAERSGGFLGQAKQLLEEGTQADPQTEEFVRVFSQRDGYGLTLLLASMEKWKREQLIPLLLQWQQLLEGGLAHRCGAAAVNPLARQLSEGRSPRDLMAALETLQKASAYAQSNVSVGAICGWLAWELR